MTFKILSIDGGGIRGVLSATILKEIEATLQAKNKPKLHEYFNLIAGTSTGSILAAGIACQLDAETLINLYKEYGRDIFLESVRQQRKWRWLSRLGLTQLFGGGYVLYPHERGEKGLAKVLEKKLRYQGKSPQIGEIAEPHLLILAYDVLSRNTTWFTNNRPDQGEWYDNIELWKICTASASAPTFFPPYELPFNQEQNIPHIDGGVSANNPALTAIAHALYIDKIDKHKTQKLNMSDIAVLSIGTGKTTRPYSHKEIEKWSLAGWVTHLPDIFMNPSAKNSEDICRQFFDSLGSTHLRLDFDLNERFQGERQPKRLREILPDKSSYNKYIFKKKNERKKISEEMDNPEVCPDLIEAAQCYLDCGEVDYKGKTMSVKSAIEQFIDDVAEQPASSDQD